MTRLLDQIEQYYDAVPRSAAHVEDFGPLSLFVRKGEGWPYYGRPSRDWSGPVAAADVDRVRARQRELGIPESFEWTAEVTPGLRAAVEESGLEVHEHPLLVLQLDDAHTPDTAYTAVARILDPADPALPSALAVPQLAFAELGTHIGTAGADELAAAVRAVLADGSVPRSQERIRAGLTAVAAAVEEGAGGQALCAGMHQPVGEVSEIVGVGTLPSARRRGLGLAVTAALLADARARGVRTVFMSASDNEVARIYGRLGFRRIATALIAEPSE